MKQGNWVPLSKALVQRLPKDRAFSEVEAMFSLTVNYDCKTPVTVAGFASRWGWSRKRVSNFLKKYGLEVSSDGRPNQHAKGCLRVASTEQAGNKQGTSRGQAEFINPAPLRTDKDQAESKQGTSKEQAGNKQGSSINEPKPKPKKKKYGSFSNVFLTDDEHEKLLGKFGEKGREDWIESLSFHIGSKGDPYKDHYRTILNWHKMRGGDPKAVSKGMDCENCRYKREDADCWRTRKSCTSFMAR